MIFRWVYSLFSKQLPDLLLLWAIVQVLANQTSHIPHCWMCSIRVEAVSFRMIRWITIRNLSNSIENFFWTRGTLPIKKLDFNEFKYLTENVPSIYWRDLNIRQLVLHVCFMLVKGNWCQRNAYMIFRHNFKGVIQAVNYALPVYTWRLLFCHNIWKGVFWCPP